MSILTSQINMDVAISSGILSARPSAGVAGRLYYATDDNGGTLYRDNGSSWEMVAAPIQLPWIRLTCNSLFTVNSQNTPPTAVSFDTVSGSFNWTNLSAPLTQITFPYNGIVQVFANDLDWGDDGLSAGLGVRKFGRRFNGNSSTVRMGSIITGVGGGQKSVQSIHFMKYVTSTDYLEFVCSQTSGTNLTSAVGLNECFIAYHVIGTYSFSGTN